MSNKLVKLGSLKGPKGEDGINGLTIKGELEPGPARDNLFPYDAKINDAYIISRNAKISVNEGGTLSVPEYPSGAKRGDVYVCVKEAITSDGNLDLIIPPIFERKFNISWYGEYNDIHIMSTYDNYVVEGYDTDEVKVNDIIIDNGNTLNSRLGNIYKVINVIEEPSDENNEGWEIVNFEDLKTGDKVIITGYDSDVGSDSGLIGFPIFPEKVGSVNTHKVYELVITETTENSGVYNISPKDEITKYTKKTLSIDDFIFNVEIPNEELQQIAFYVYKNHDNIETEKKYYLQVNGKTAPTLRTNSSLNELKKLHLFELETDSNSVAYNYIKSLSTELDEPSYISLYSTTTDGVLGYVDWRHYAVSNNGVMKNQKFKIYRMKKSIPSAIPKVIVDTVASVNISQRNLYHSGDNISVKNNTISALGYNHNVSKLSLSEGNSTASGANSHAEGNLTTASGVNSHAEGYKTTASGKSSHAEGNGVEAVGLASHAEGWHNIDSTTSAMYTVNQDTEDNTKYYIVSDFQGTDGGGDGIFYLKYGMTFLYNNKYYCVTEVFYDETNPDNPTAFRLNQSIGKTDTNDFDIKLIVGKSIGECSHTEGCNTVAYSNHAHAEGNSTRAAGINSHTEGVETSAVGKASHAEGQSSIAIGTSSHTEGTNTIATNSSEHAEGRYNVSNTGSKEKDKTISSIGIGTSNTVRKNALEVMQNGDMYVYGLGDYDGTNPETATTLQQCINDGVGSQSFGGYVYIEKYDKTNFENALKTALSDVKTAYDNGTNKNAVILDCTYFTGTHVLSTGFTGFNLYTPVKLVFGSIKIVFNNPGDNNLFNIYHNDISIVGINRNTDVSQIATGDTAPNGATLFIMGGDENNSDNLNGYHIKSSGFKNILIDSITLKGKRSEMGEYYQSTSNPISGIGGIYIEKGDPTSTATSGLTCNNVRINNVLISDTKAHGIYINTPILSSITNTRLSGCGGHGIYILGGTSINMENVYASSGNFAGFCIQNASYVQLANCVAETFGIGFLIRGSNSVTLHCPGVEQTTNFGRYPWRNTLTGEITSPQSSNKIYGLGLLHTGSTTIIKDVVSGLDTCFIGYGIYITGGDGINVFSPYIKSIGQSKSSTIGYPSGTTPSAQLNFISVVGEANLVNIINPHFKMSDEELSIIQTIKNEIKIGKDAKYVDISYSTDSSPLKEKIEGVLKYTTNNTDIACIYTENGENINTITLKIDNVYESLYAKTMYAENGFYETSDARKKDIQGELPLDKAYDFIRNCEPILYNLKGSDKTQIGLIAQEVREFFPEIVNEDDEGYLSLDYAKLTVVILRVLKDLIDKK